VIDKSGSYGLLLAIALALPSSAAAQAAPPEVSTPYLTGTCTNCHGTLGRSAGAMPNLAGLSPPYFVEQMKQFREGKRPATIMHQIAKGYTDAQIDLLAEYFARQTPAR
jgi:cytochrome subunit of sulfide dehydrogenase